MNKESELTFELVSAFLEGIDRRDFLSTEDCKRINEEESTENSFAYKGMDGPPPKQVLPTIQTFQPRKIY